MFIRQSLKKYLHKLASDSPTPGGGSASAVVAAMGTGLLLMVARIVRKRLTQKQTKSIDRTIRLLTKILKDTEEVVDLDVRVYRTLMESYRAMKKVKNEEIARRRPASPAERGERGPLEAARKKVEVALANSFRLQADLALLILMAKETLPSLLRVVKGSIANDLLVARAFLDGAFEGALATSRINLAYMESVKKKHFTDGLDRLEEKYRGIKISR